MVLSRFARQFGKLTEYTSNDNPSEAELRRFYKIVHKSIKDYVEVCEAFSEFAHHITVYSGIVKFIDKFDLREEEIGERFNDIYPRISELHEKFNDISEMMDGLQEILND
jgi:hypothetical protein